MLNQNVSHLNVRLTHKKMGELAVRHAECGYLPVDTRKN